MPMLNLFMNLRVNSVLNHTQLLILSWLHTPAALILFASDILDRICVLALHLVLWVSYMRSVLWVLLFLFFVIGQV